MLTFWELWLCKKLAKKEQIVQHQNKSAHWNIRILYECDKLETRATSFSIDILGICETLWTGNGNLSIKHCEIIYSGKGRQCSQRRGCFVLSGKKPTGLLKAIGTSLHA